MNLLAEVSDKIVSTGQFWAVMAIVSVIVGGMAVALRWWAAMLIAALISALGCVLTLSFLNDAVFGDAVLRESGWSWFASKIAASLLPVATVIVVMVWRKPRRDAVGFEVVR